MASVESPPSASDAIARQRWLVHLALMVGFLSAVLSAVFLSRHYLGHSGVTDHSIIGGAVLCLVTIHLIQRRRTVGRLAARLVHIGGSARARAKIAVSDLILLLLTLNVMVSGLADFLSGNTIDLPVGLPAPLRKWHAFGVIVLVVYVIVHVMRRRHRLRTSHIR